MTQTKSCDGPCEQGGWIAAGGLRELFRILGLAVHPAKLGLALAAIIATFVYGGVLDLLWTRGGGVSPDAVGDFIVSCETDTPYEEGGGDEGIFRTWREHERRCILGLLGSSIPGASVAAGTPVGSYVAEHSRAQPLRNLSGMAYGVFWLMRYHPVFFILFAAGALVIWSLAGGGICRLAAVQFARDDKLTIKQGLDFARNRLFGGFFLAPCIPLAFVMIVMVVMALGGVVLRIPWLGDLLSVFFVLALFGGFAIALLLLGLLFGGSLFWPVVAAEGSDAFDAFSRGLAYPFSRPWKAILYFVIATVYASICWLFVNLFTFFSLTITRGIVAWGTSPFGWWSRGAEGSGVSKLELLWPLSGPNALYSWPDWSELGYLERFSAVVIGLYVLLTIGLMWAFLASFYFSASTVIYFLLRRDVDGADLGDVYVEDEASAPVPTRTSGGSEPPSGASGGGSASLPVTGSSEPTPPA
jgi:hypothetical protein